MSRRLALTKKVSLADLADNWDDCFAIVRLATFAEFVEYSNQKPKKAASVTEKLEPIFKVVETHLVGGKIKVFVEGNDDPQLLDITAEDVRSSLPMANKLAAVILGIKLDPKDSPKAA